MSLRRADPRVFAHLAYTTFFEHVVTAAANTSVAYAQVLAVKGAIGLVTVQAPRAPRVNIATGYKDAAHFLVINCDGAQQINVVSPDGKNFNGQAGPFAMTAGDPASGALFLWANDQNGWVVWCACCAPPT